ITTHKVHWMMFGTTLGIILACMAIISVLSGFKHEVVKFKSMLVSIVIVLLFQYVFGDPLKFVLLSIDRATWPRQGYVPPMSDVKEDPVRTRRAYLRMQLGMQRSNLHISSKYRNFRLNEQYKLIASDLLIYGRFFICLLCLVTVTRDERLYHNTRIVKLLLMNNHTDYYGLKEVLHMSQLFDFIASALVSAFNSNDGGGSWVHAEQTVLVGVIRLRQLRVKSTILGWDPPDFTDDYYMPDWLLPYRGLHYADKYWRIYEPFTPFSRKIEFLDGLLLNFNHRGFLNLYPELMGYSSLLARGKENSMKVLDYLTEYHWLTLNTTAVFIDFTLYNADENLFSICTLRVEKTPFGSILPAVEVESARLSQNVDEMPYKDLLALLIYVVVLIQYSQALAIRLWYEPDLMKDFWNKMDLVISLLNVVVVILVVLREWLVQKMMKQVAGASKMDFIDFRRPARMHQVTTMTVGFLICITTLRLWRVLQFSSVFKLFTRTLYQAWAGVASTAMVIVFFLVGYSFAVVTINGSNSGNFNSFIKSMVMCMSFSFGFSAQVKPSELFHGGEWLGIMLYAALAFVIAMLLINVFVSMINDYFVMSKTMRDDSRSGQWINFFQFLRVEYTGFFGFFQSLPIFRHNYLRNNRTVSENVERKLAAMDRRRRMASRQKRRFYLYGETIKETDSETKYRDRGEKLVKMSQLLQTQMQLLDSLLNEEEEEAEKKKEKEKGKKEPKKKGVSKRRDKEES
ncbi:hypothetical protein KR009_005467, partial [Drosophila setifemur]